MKFVALVSGGKDSIFAILEAQKQGHELVACVHLGRPTIIQKDNDDEEEEESYMYQTAGSEVVPILVEECIQVPLVNYIRQGKSVQTSLVYENENLQESSPSSTTTSSQNGGDDDDDDDSIVAQKAATAATTDEVEDLYQALRLAVERFPSIRAVSSGALLSTYQRVRIENVCQRLGLTSLSYLWRAGSQHEILRRMIVDEAQLDVVLVRTAAPPGLLPRKHLNKTLAHLMATKVLDQLYDRYRMHVCGEGGEYESLCLYAPGLYKKRLVLDEVEIRTDDNDDDVGILVVKSCHAQDLEPNHDSKEQNIEGSSATALGGPSKDEPVHSTPPSNKECEIAAAEIGWSPPPTQWLPRVHCCQGGLWHTCAIVSPKTYPPVGSSSSAPPLSEADLAVSEARDVLYLLQTLLALHQCTAQDVGMVHLYLSDISHFQRINQYYRQCFGVLLPPSRSCVALGDLPNGKRVMLDCWVLAGSGEYMRRQGVETNNNNNNNGTKSSNSPYTDAALANTAVKYRQVLHVQSLSHWAPVCVGPYSQANTLLGALHFLAGSIGLWPASMKLRDTWTSQLAQSWKNLAQILDALDLSSLTHNMLSGMVYVSEEIYNSDPSATKAMIAEISQRQMTGNAGVVPGLIDDMQENVPSKNDGYEDEETRLALEGTTSDEEMEQTPSCPLLVVAIPSMPMGAQVEVEITAASRTAAKSLRITPYRGKRRQSHELALSQNKSSSWDAGYDLDSWSDKIHGEDAMEIRWSLRTLGVAGAAVATCVALQRNDSPDSSLDTEIILRGMIQGLSDAVSATSGSLQIRQLFQLRLYYVSSQQEGAGTVFIDVAAQLEASLAASLPEGLRPAVTIVPVHGMEYLDFEESALNDRVLLALQATFLDPVSIQTELWIRQGRPAE